MTTVLTGCRVGHDRWPTGAPSFDRGQWPSLRASRGGRAKSPVLDNTTAAAAGATDSLRRIRGPRPAIVAPDASAALTSAIENPPSGPITSRSGGGKANRRGPSDRSNSRTEPGPMTSASGTGSTTSGTAPRSDCSAASRATARRRHARGRDRARHASIGDDELEPGHADLGSLADHRLQVILSATPGRW